LRELCSQTTIRQRGPAARATARPLRRVLADAYPLIAFHWKQSQMQDDPAERYDFYRTVVCNIPGWLHQGTAMRTMDMLAFQEKLSIQGAVLEIGVMCGRYFSILLRSAARTKSKIVGIDLFHDHPTSKVLEYVAPAVGDNRHNVQLIQAFSTDIDANFLNTQLGSRARFVSIDGSHEKDDVFWDLNLAEQVVAPGGIVALDDFINPVTFGVNEAAHTFFSQPRRLAPWAYIENKLFLCQRHWAHRYMEMLEETVMHDDIEPHSKVFREHARIGRGLVEQRLWGNPLLIVN
jgi:predicted O-methyltransferase YrrM